MTSIYPQPLPAPRRRPVERRSNLPIVVGVLLFCAIIFVVIISVFFLFVPNDGIGLFHEKVAVVQIFGTILDSEDWVELLEECADSDSIAAVVLNVDSPGGGITPTQEIYEAVRKIKSEGKPVIAYMGSVAASGGYYAACAADEIYAMSGTLTGSIGVYMQMVNISDLLERMGVEFDTIKKGAYKTAGDFSRNMKGHERAMFQAVIDDYYKQFLDAVTDSRNRNRVSLAKGWNESLPGGSVPDGTGTASLNGVLYPSSAWGSISPGLAPTGIVAAASGTTVEAEENTSVAAPVSSQVPSITGTVVAPARGDTEKLAQLFADNLTKEAIRKRVEALAEGRIYTGRQAVAVGLVDKIGTLQEAINRAGEACGLGEDPDTVTKKKDEPSGLFSLKAKVDLFTGSRFLYLCPFGI
jgi:signal peptide peptidase SppA